VVPNAVDVEHHRRQPGHPRPDGDTLLFFGSLGYAPNLDGILHFLDRIWPAVLARRPATRLEIVGPGAPPALLARRSAQVELIGFVEDLRPRLAGAAAVIAPLRLGGGTRLKILEAMAMGRPVVSTSLGAEGLEVRDGEELLLADEPAEFAGAVVRLLEDPRLGERLGRAARARVEQRYSWRTAAERFERFVAELAVAPT
jgi:glycosyltransferase involved in cell wall biosynthesis